jgi:hypothetical protein
MDDGEEGWKGCLMGVSLTRDDCQEIAYRVKPKHTNQRTRPGGPLQGFVDVKWGTLLHSKASGSPLPPCFAPAIALPSYLTLANIVTRRVSWVDRQDFQVALRSGVQAREPAIPA